MDHFGDHDGKSKTSSAVDEKHYPQPTKKENAGAIPLPSQSEIAQLAYELWEKRGFPPDSDVADWLEAEQRLMKEKGVPTQTRLLAAQAGSVQK